MKNKKVNRCIISGKIVTPNKEVVLKDSLEEYIIKSGKTRREAQKIIDNMEK